MPRPVALTMMPDTYQRPGGEGHVGCEGDRDHVVVG
jgi:hypothetical protein